VVTYFPNLDPTLAQQGVFRSRYWGELHDLLDKGPWRVNWIWRYTPSEEVSFAEAASLRQRFQEKAGGRAGYFFLEEFLTAGALLKAVQLYLRLCVRGLRLKSVRQAFHFPGSKLNFWPFLARDWGDSLFGSEALEGCLALATFESLAVLLPPQEWGLYLWENLPWERALNWAWKDAGQGKLIGFQHAGLAFLDLRFFEDPRSYRLAQYPPPLPDLLAVNGAGPLSLLDEVGYPQERRVTVEAVRCQSLGPYLNQGMAKEPIFRATGLEPRTLLVVTGYLASETFAQLRLLAQVAQKGGLAGYERVLVKPHPDCPVNGILTEVAPELNVAVVQEPLGQLWPQATLVYTANSTSASVEAALMGLPVIVHLVEDSLNFSPLWGRPGVPHVSTVAALLHGLTSPKTAAVPNDYFCLEKGLPRWLALLRN
jgi:surface carbohydrate biosynthesis protein (TIGR04326 family)